MGKIIIKRNGEKNIIGRVHNIIDKSRPNMCIPDVGGLSLNKINDDLKDHFKHTYYIENDTTKAPVLLQHYVRVIDIDSEYDRKILIQPIDGTVINPYHVNIINQYDILVTPSNIGKVIMLKNGVTRPIHVIPNYYDDIKPSDYFKKSDKFTFYNESTGIPRKNIKNLIETFVKVFNGRYDVILVLKLDKYPFRNLFSSFIDVDTNVDITIISDNISQTDLESIMSNIDCYVCPSYMEGFCIPLLKALKWNKKIIALDSSISGYMDFLNHENAFLVKCNRIPIKTDTESLLIWGEESEWEEPDYGDMGEAMLRAVVSDNPLCGDISRYSKECIMTEYDFIVNNKIHEFTFGRFYLPNDLGSNHLVTNSYNDWERHFDDHINKLPVDMNVIDIGAHVGFITTKLSKRFSKGKIFSFEPASLSYQYLSKNVELNCLDNVTLFNNAVGNIRADVGMSDNENLFLNEVNLSGSGIQMVCIDDMNLPEIGLIKIDTEGFEMEVLSGAMGIIQRDHPILVIEIHEHLYDKYVKRLGEMGYGVRYMEEYNYICEWVGVDGV